MCRQNGLLALDDGADATELGGRRRRELCSHAGRPDGVRRWRVCRVPLLLRCSSPPLVDLLADPFQLFEAVGVTALVHLDRLLNHIDLALLVVKALVQLGFHLEVRPAKRKTCFTKFSSKALTT